MKTKNSSSCGPEVGYDDWSVRYDEGAQAWGVFLGGIRRALVPLLGARPYRTCLLYTSDAADE